MFSKIKRKRMSGAEKLVDTTGREIATLSEFWSWAYSDIMDNAERGALAEFIVACALGIKNSDRVSWDKYDLITNEGIAVEVKTSGYLQSWYQKELSKLAFGIRPTHGWEAETNTYGEEQRRQSDIYVFCVHKHTDEVTVDPLKISQWDFYLMPTVLLNEKFKSQKSATLSSLIKAGAVKCEYDKLHEEMQRLVKK